MSFRKAATFNIHDVPPGEILFPSEVKRIVVTPSIKGPVYLCATKGPLKSAWFSLFPEDKWEVCSTSKALAQATTAKNADALVTADTENLTLEAKLDVDTLVVPTGATAVEVLSPAAQVLSVAAWTNTKKQVKTFLEQPTPCFLPVPFRSQMVETAVAPRRICLPTSLAMVLHFHGVNKTTASVARLTYDSHHGIYGNWVKACLTARNFGFAARVEAMETLSQLLPYLNEGLPLVVSIGYEEGQLPGAPISCTNGHLIVICGIDEQGDLICRDPAASNRIKGEVVYEQKAFVSAWKGMAIIVRPLTAKPS